MYYVYKRNLVTAPLSKIEGCRSHHTHRRDGYGGVATYVNSNIPSTLLSDYCVCNDTIKLCTVKIMISISSYLYLPYTVLMINTKKVHDFDSFMDNFLSQNIFTNNYNQSIISGDSNINLLQHETPSDKPFFMHNAIF